VSRVIELWAGRSPRERRVMASGAAAALALILVALVWLPLERSRTRIAAELPQLRASVALMQRQAEEVKRLRALAPTPLAAAPLAKLVAQNAWTRDLPGLELAIIDDKHLRLHGENIAFGALLEWLATARAAHGLRVETAHIEALQSVGRVRAELLLARS